MKIHLKAQAGVSLTYRDAARVVLLMLQGPLHADAITEIATKANLLLPHGKTPPASMRAVLARDAAFVRVAPGVYDLAERVQKTAPAMTNAANNSQDGRLDFVGAAETAEIFGVEVQRVPRWRRTGRLPEPHVTVAATPLWVRSDIETLAQGGELSVRPRPAVPPVMGTNEVAHAVGVDKSQVARWRRKPSKRGPAFPEPVLSLRSGPLWRTSSIQAFTEARVCMNAG